MSTRDELVHRTDKDIQIPLNLTVFNSLSYQAGSSRNEATITHDESDTESAVPKAIWDSVVTNDLQIVLNVPGMIRGKYITRAVLLSGTGDRGAVTVGDVYDTYNKAARKIIQKMEYEGGDLYSDGCEERSYMHVLEVRNNRL
jgi:hypothetical protein